MSVVYERARRTAGLVVVGDRPTLTRCFQSHRLHYPMCTRIGRGFYRNDDGIKVWLEMTSICALSARSAAASDVGRERESREKHIGRLRLLERCRAPASSRARVSRSVSDGGDVPVPLATNRIINASFGNCPLSATELHSCIGQHRMRVSCVILPSSLSFLSVQLSPTNAKPVLSKVLALLTLIHYSTSNVAVNRMCLTTPLYWLGGQEVTNDAAKQVRRVPMLSSSLSPRNDDGSSPCLRAVNPRDDGIGALNDHWRCHSLTYEEVYPVGTLLARGAPRREPSPLLSVVSQSFAVEHFLSLARLSSVNEIVQKAARRAICYSTRPPPLSHCLSEPVADPVSAPRPAALSSLLARHLTPFYEPPRSERSLIAAASIGVILSGVVYFLHSSRSTIDVYAHERLWCHQPLKLWHQRPGCV
ncbi:unnamed protein product [Strongylus vulgaris]|uniref:Uncharacterized protein n=1 Tax=Strongylus vulgaris TaxID=40348 RepID=A0A3P7LJ81_STRVU|nr:unnamed protein product [Strongylus vulgaris]